MVESHLETIERSIDEGEIDPSVDAESVSRIIISYALMSIQMRLADLEAEGRRRIPRGVPSKISWFSMDRRAGITHLRVCEREIERKVFAYSLV